FPRMGIPPAIAVFGIAVGLMLGLMAGLFPSLAAYRARVTDLLRHARMALPIAYNIRSLFVRWKSTLLAMTGIAMVVAVFVGLLSMASGLRSAFRETGSDKN